MKQKKIKQSKKLEELYFAEDIKDEEEDLEKYDDDIDYKEREFEEEEDG